MEIGSNKSIDSILKSYAFPHRFYVKYACICARKAMALVKYPDSRSLEAIALAERFGNGEDIPQTDLRDAAAYAAASYSATATTTAAAAYASYAAAASAAASAYAAYASYAATASAFSAASAAAYYAAAAASAYTTAASAYTASASAATAYSAAEKKCNEELKSFLIEMINRDFTEFELIMMKKT